MRTLDVRITLDSRGAIAGVSALDAAVAKSQSRMSAMGATLSTTGKKMSGVGRSMTRSLTMPIVGLGYAAVKSFGDFDKAMTESLAILSGVTPKIRRQMEATARTVGKTTVISAEEAANAYFYLASAGLDANQAMAAMPAVARFAQAGAFDMALATDLATDAQSALGLKSKNSAKNLENLTRVTDVFTKANMLANTSVLQISEAMTNKAGAALRALGKDVEEGSAVLSAFADQGLKGMAAGEALNIVLRDLQKSALKQPAAFREAGIAVFDSAGEMRNMGDIVGQLEKHLMKMSDAQRRAALMTLGFQDRSVSNIVTLLGTSKAIKRYEKELRSAGGATELVAKKQLESFSNKMKVVKGRLTDVAITAGAKLAPAIETMAGKLGSAVEGFGNMSQHSQELTLKLVALAALSGPVLRLAGTIMSAAGAAMTFAATPFGAAVIAVGLGSLLAAKHVGLFDEKLSDTERLATFAAAGVDRLKAAQDRLANATASMPQLKLNAETARLAEKDANANLARLKKEGASYRDIVNATNLAKQAEINRINSNKELRAAQHSVNNDPKVIDREKEAQRFLKDQRASAAAADKINSLYSGKSGTEQFAKGIISLVSMGKENERQFRATLNQMLKDGTTTVAELDAAMSGTMHGEASRIVGDVLKDMEGLSDAEVAIKIGASPDAFLGHNANAWKLIHALNDGYAIPTIDANPTLFDNRVRDARASLNGLNGATASPTVGLNLDPFLGGIANAWRQLHALNSGSATVTPDAHPGATGGIVTRPTLALIGEAGPEAVVPLNRTPGSSPLPTGRGPGPRPGGGDSGRVVVNLTINAQGAVMAEEAWQRLVSKATSQIADRLRSQQARSMNPLLGVS